MLARGDRRGFVALDADGKVWSLSRWCGVKPKEMRKRLGSEMDLPSVAGLPIFQEQKHLPFMLSVLASAARIAIKVSLHQNFQLLRAMFRQL